MRGLAFGVAVLIAGAAGCADEVECPEGRDKVGSHCVLLDEEGDPSTVGDDAGDIEEGPDGMAPEEARESDDDAGPQTDHLVDAGSDAMMPELSCLADFDHDGYGVQSDAGCEEGLMSGDCADDDETVHPGASDTCADGLDRDCDGHPGISELCNGVDDDCDSVADNGYGCVRGAANVSCSTVCGSTGKGTCTNECTLPSGPACTPPAETCNWKDDDCDGVADEGLLSRLSTQPFAVHGTASGNSNQVALVARKGGGAWVISNRTTLQGLFDPLAVQELNNAGQPVGAAGTLLGTERMQLFVADSDGNAVAVLGMQRNPDGSDPTNTLILMVYDAATLTLTAQHEVLKYTNDPGSSDDCDRIYPVDVSIFKSGAGQTHVAAGYITRVNASTTMGCDAGAPRTSVLEVFRAGAESQYKYTKSLGGAPDGNLRGRVGVVKVPCREEWLGILQSASSVDVLRLYPEASEKISDKLALPLHASACEGADSWVAAVTPSGYELFKSDSGTGALSKIATRPSVPLTDYSLVSLSGRWFAFGISGATAAAVEFTWGPSPTERAFPVVRMSAPADSSLPGQYSSNKELQGLLLPQGLHDALVLDQTVVSLFARGNSGSALVAGGNPAAAITYRFGCN